MTWRKAFYNDLAAYFNLPERAEIIDVTEKSEWSGYCSTCRYENFVVAITYSFEGELLTENYSGKFVELMNDVDPIQ